MYEKLSKYFIAANIRWDKKMIGFLFEHIMTHNNRIPGTVTKAHDMLKTS